MILHHFLNHIVGRANHIVNNPSGLNNGIHFFVCLKGIVNHLDSRLFFKELRNFRVYILSRIVDRNDIVPLRIRLIPLLRSIRLTLTASYEKGESKTKEEHRKNCDLTRASAGTKISFTIISFF